MRVAALLGLLGPAGLFGFSSAQQYGNSPGTSEGGVTGSGSATGSESGQETCPFLHSTTVFVTVTPVLSPSVISTYVSTLVVDTSPALGNPGQEGSSTDSLGTSSLSSGTDPLSWSPAGASATNPALWSTDFFTLTLPPGPGGTTSSIVTYTIVSPEGSSPSETNSGGNLQTLTVTQPAGSGQGGESIILTLTSPFSLASYSGPSGISPLPSQTEGTYSPSGGITPSAQYTETVSKGGSGSQDSLHLPTITITLPGELPTGSNGGGGGTQAPQTFTLTIPSGSNESGSQTSSITSTIESPTGPSGGTGGTQPLQTFTVTIPTSEAGNQPQTLTITAPAGSPTSPNGSNGGSQPLQTSTATIPSGEAGSQPQTLTVTAPNGSPTGTNAISGPLQTFTVTIPSGEDGGQPRTLTITAPGGPTTSIGGVGGTQPIQSFTVTIPNSEAGSQPQTLTITAPNSSPTSPYDGTGGSTGGFTGENQPIQTFTLTVPGGEAGSQPQTLTIIAPNGPATSTNSGTIGSQPIQTYTITLPSGEAWTQPQTLTITAPDSSPNTPNGGLGENTSWNQPIPTITITLPSGQAGSEPQTLTITAPNGSPISTSTDGNQPLQTFTVTIPNGDEGGKPQTLTITVPNGSATGPTVSAGETQPIQTFTVTEPNGLSTFTLTVPEQSPTGYGIGSSQGGNQGSGGTQPLPTVPITAPTESATGNGRLSGQPIATITLTIPDQTRTGGEEGPWGSQPLQTFTITLPSESPSSTTGGFGSGGTQPLETLTITLPSNPNGPEGQNGPQTITVTAIGGSSGPINQGTSSCDENESIFPSGGPWLSSQTAGPWPVSGNSGGPLASTSPCTDDGFGESGAPWPFNTGTPPIPVITATLSEGPQGNPFGVSSELSGSPLMSEDPSGPTEAYPNGGYGTSVASEVTIFPPEVPSDTAANSNLAPGATTEPLSYGAQVAGASAATSPIPTGLTRGPFSSVPSSGWNFSTSASEVGPVSESTSLPVADSNPSETTSCADSTAQPGATVSIPLIPSFPPPVSPAFTFSGEGPTLTSPPVPDGSPVDGAGSEAPASCLSMTTLVISTITFSWCNQVATSISAGASISGQGRIQNAGSLTANSLSPTPIREGYEWDPAPMDRRSLATMEALPNSAIPKPSTLATVVIPSRSREDTFASSETSSCGASDDRGSFTHNFDDLMFRGANRSDQPSPVLALAPYHRFYYTGGFALVSQPPVPFTPSSGKVMLQFTPSSTSQTSENRVPRNVANIGVGSQNFAPCFSFNFTGVKLGCDSKEVPCSFTFTGFKYNHDLRGTIKVISQTVSVPVCQDAEKCALAPVTVSNFNDLTSITVTAEVNGKSTMWWADDFAFGWFDNTCDSGMCRSRLPNGIPERGWSVTGRQAASKLMSLIGALGP